MTSTAATVFSQFLWRAWSDYVAAIDLDPAMLTLARDRALTEGLTNCTFTVGNAYDLEKLVPGRVDWVLIANTFHGVPDKTRLACAVAAS